MRLTYNPIGIEPFTVKVDDSPQLVELVEQSKELRHLPFKRKLEAVKKLTLDAMVNAYEQMIVWEKEKDSFEGVQVIGSNGKNDDSDFLKADANYQKFRDIVFTGHPLSYALEQKAGCCRYQGALFFILGYNAKLGDKHFVQAAPIKEGVNTVFNEVVDDGRIYNISIFAESLQNESLDYTRQNPRIFEQAFKEFPGLNMYSYHSSRNCVIVENPAKHIRKI